MLRTTVSRIIRLGIPLLAGNFAVYLMKAVDLAMLGRLGTDTLAAAGIATIATGVLYTLIWPVALGVQALASRRYGRQLRDGDGDAEAEETGRVVANGAAAGWLAAALALLLSLLVEPLLRRILANPALVDLSLQYIRTLRWSLPVLCLGMAHRGFLAAVNRTHLVMAATLLTNGLNILLNWILIYGNLGFPVLGMRGAALGTLLAEAVYTLLLVGYGLSAPDLRRYRLLRFRHLEGSMIRDIIRNMVPPGVQNAAALTIFLTYQTMVERLGTEYLAVTGLLFTMFRINKTLVGGFAQGASILVGNRLGAGDRKGAAEVFAAQQLIALAIGLVIAASLLAAPRAVLGLFSLSPGLVPLGVSAIRFFTLFFFIEVTGYSLEIIFSHNGWGTLVLVSEFVTNVIFILGLTWAGVWIFGWGIYGAWAGFAAYQVAHAAILFVGYLSGRWRDVEVERNRPAEEPVA